MKQPRKGIGKRRLETQTFRSKSWRVSLTLMCDSQEQSLWMLLRQHHNTTPSLTTWNALQMSTLCCKARSVRSTRKNFSRTSEWNTHREFSVSNKLMSRAEGIKDSNKNDHRVRLHQFSHQTTKGLQEALSYSQEVPT